MTNNFLLSDADRQLLLQLLERERSELAVEIHHCEVPEAKEVLRHRRDEIEKLAERVKNISTACV
jgi:hypothetical protein